VSWQPTAGPSTADTEAMLAAIRKRQAEAEVLLRELVKHFQWVDDVLYDHAKRIDGDRK